MSMGGRQGIALMLPWGAMCSTTSRRPRQHLAILTYPEGMAATAPNKETHMICILEGMLCLAQVRMP